MLNFNNDKLENSHKIVLIESIYLFYTENNYLSIYIYISINQGIKQLKTLP